MVEQWIVLAENNNYEFSNQGNLRHIKTGRYKKLIPAGSSYYYSIYQPGSRSKPFKRSVARLMRDYFPDEWLNQLRNDELVKPIEGFDGYYITTHGRVFSINSYRWLNSYLSHDYYYSVALGRVPRDIHTLVGRAFLPDYQEGLLICHHNEDLPEPEIYHLNNLFTGNHIENAQDMIDKGRGRWQR